MNRFEGVGLSCGNFKTEDVGKRIFGGENTVRTQMQVEAALARVQARLGVIPQAAADEINRKCDVSLIDEAEYRRQYAITNHPLVCLIRVYASICDGDAGEYIHYGTTTQDIIDTAAMLQLKEAYGLIQEKTLKLRNRIAALARANKDLVMMGRTNDQQAMPITLGFKMATWVDELDRSIDRLAQSKDRIFVGSFFGAVGTLASLEDKGLEIQQQLMAELGLGDSRIMWFTSRDRLVELISNLAILSGTLGRIANEVYNGQRSEVDELSEGFKPGKVGSSTMPHKRNPFIPGEIISYARLSRSVVVDALTCMEGTNERDVRTIGLENEFLARGCCLADAALSRALVLMEDLEIHTNGIRRNLDLLGGLVYAEALMMRLSADCGRLEAHELIYELAQTAISEHRPFRQVLLADPRVGSKLTEADLDEIMNPAHYIGLSTYFTETIAGADR